jgi:hypothetical protein
LYTLSFLNSFSYSPSMSMNFSYLLISSNTAALLRSFI